MQTLEPRKIPRQGRSRATVDAILDACAEGLTSRGYEALTTNAISERAGVSIGTLYEYFPNREAIAAALAGRTFQHLCEVMRAALHHCIRERLSDLDGVEHMLESGMAVMVADRAVFKALVYHAPFIFQLPAVREARGSLIELANEVRAVAGNRLSLPMPEADGWLIAQMLSATMLEIASLDAPDEHRRRLTRELARLTYRMAVGHDPAAVRVPTARTASSLPEVELRRA
ncbi:MAG: TetR/AcrR family transcriptional regulator [Pseudomonadota bacterium]